MPYFITALVVLAVVYVAVMTGIDKYRLDMITAVLERRSLKDRLLPVESPSVVEMVKEIVSSIWKKISLTVPSVTEPESVSIVEATDEPKSLVQAVVETVKEKVAPPKRPSVRMDKLGKKVAFNNGDGGFTHRGVVVNANRHATRLAIAARINGAPCVVWRRAKNVDWFI
jgi:hypothetical protein